MAKQDDKNKKTEQAAPKKDKGKASEKVPAKGKTPAKGKAPATDSKKKKGQEAIPPLPTDYIPRLRKLYRDRIVPALVKQFGYKNPTLVPHLDKIVLNVGIGTLHQDPKLAESVAEELAIISGQKPVFTTARKSIANFKLRDGMIIGCRVTLRRERMYEFFDRLISIVVPRVRDFRGLNDRSFDGRGNYNFGIREQIVFPEIDYDKVVKMHGMDITIATTASTDEEAMELLKGFGFPFLRRTDAA